jgi:hypothetical protein
MERPEKFVMKDFWGRRVIVEDGLLGEMMALKENLERVKVGFGALNEFFVNKQRTSIFMQMELVAGVLWETRKPLVLTIRIVFHQLAVLLAYNE